MFNPTHSAFGNTVAAAMTACPSEGNGSTMIDWVYTKSATYDLRMTLLDCTMGTLGPVFTQGISNWQTCNVQQISPFTNLPVCYTTEACKYAQTGYLVGVVLCQVANGYACKTRKTSVISQGASNTFFHFALTTEVLLMIILTYLEPLSSSFGFRDVIFMHFGMPTLPFMVLVMCVDETRKYYIRNLPVE